VGAGIADELLRIDTGPFAVAILGRILVLRIDESAADGDRAELVAADPGDRRSRRRPRQPSKYQ
jgi:hypothetical protein